MPEVNQTAVPKGIIRRENKRDKETIQEGIPPPPQEAVERLSMTFTANGKWLADVCHLLF